MRLSTWILCIASVLWSLVAFVCVADTPGATEAPGCDRNAASFSWTGLLESGVETQIQVTVHKESYIMDQSSNPSVRFVIQHDNESCWGNVLLTHSRIWEGKYGYFEEVQVPVRREGGEWKGSITIVPCPSIRCIHVCMLPNINTPFFGVSLVRMAREDALMIASLSEQGLLIAKSLHSAAWEEMAQRSATNPYYMYGLYAARSLAVAHPETYLQADALFLDYIAGHSGFASAFAETDPHSASYFARTFFSGSPFSLDLLDLDRYQTMTNAARFPSDVAVFGFLDRRVLSLASCLKDSDLRITALEKSTILYFKLREKSHERPFIVYCADETAYVASQDQILCPDGGAVEGKLTSDAILIFNEDFVWYPLMGRDDTARSRSLRELVAEYGAEDDQPTMTAQERRLAEVLGESTKLHSTKEWDLAKLAAVKGSSWVYPFRSICKKYLIGYPLEVWIFAIQQRWVHCANSISPWTSWLAAYVLDSTATDRGVETMTGVWQRRLGMIHGHVWQCSLIRYTIDESVSIGAVHCVLHANSLSSVLDLAGVNNIVIQGSPGPPGEPNRTHTYVALPDIGMVISNGEVTRRGTLIDEPYSTLYYISQGDDWAFPFIDFYVGTWPPRDVALEFESIRQEYGDQFHGFQSETGIDRFRKTIVVSEEYLIHLSSEQEDWHPFRHP